MPPCDTLANGICARHDTLARYTRQWRLRARYLGVVPSAMAFAGTIPWRDTLSDGLGRVLQYRHKVAIDAAPPTTAGRGVGVGGRHLGRVLQHRLRAHALPRGRRQGHLRVGEGRGSAPRQGTHWSTTWLLSQACGGREHAGTSA